MKKSEKCRRHFNNFNMIQIKNYFFLNPFTAPEVSKGASRKNQHQRCRRLFLTCTLPRQKGGAYGAQKRTDRACRILNATLVSAAGKVFHLRNLRCSFLICLWNITGIRCGFLRFRIRCGLFSFSYLHSLPQAPFAETLPSP